MVKGKMFSNTHLPKNFTYRNGKRLNFFNAEMINEVKILNAKKRICISFLYEDKTI